MVTAATPLQPGQRVRIIQQIPQGTATWTTSVEGEILALRQAKTGSWFAHSKDDRLWLDRLDLRRADGEIVVCNLDRFSRIEVLSHAAAAASPGSPSAGAE